MLMHFISSQNNPQVKKIFTVDTVQSLKTFHSLPLYMTHGYNLRSIGFQE